MADCGGPWLGIALGTVVNLLSPQAIVLGGHFAPMTEWLSPVIASELAAAGPRRQRRRAALMPSSLGAEAAMRGAAATQWRRVLADPTLVGVESSSPPWPPWLPPPPERSTSIATQRPLERRTVVSILLSPARRPEKETRSKRVLLVTLTRIVPRSESRIWRNARAPRSTDTTVPSY